MIIKSMARAMVTFTIIVILVSNVLAANNSLKLAYLIPWSRGWKMGPYIGSAFLLGIESVKERQLLPGYEIEWTWSDTQCEPLRGIKMAVETWNKMNGLDGIIGDGCSIICESVSLLASAWGIPMISWGCASPILSDKKMHPTLTRTLGPWSNLAPMFNTIADQFGWNRVGVICDHTDLTRITAEATKKEMESAGKTVFFYIIEQTMNGKVINPVAYKKQKQIVRSMKNLVRVLFIITYAYDARNILISAYDEGMLTEGYAYICMDIAFLKEPNPTFTFRPELGKFLFDGVIIGTPFKPAGKEWDEFARQVIDSFDHPAFEDVEHLPPTAQTSEVESFGGILTKICLAGCLPAY